MNIKPCPFCGAEMSYIRITHGKYAKPQWASISCRCGAMMGDTIEATDEGTEAALIDYLIEKWNRRAE